jgi:hypothetical protein
VVFAERFDEERLRRVEQVPRRRVVALLSAAVRESDWKGEKKNKNEDER